MVDKETTKKKTVKKASVKKVAPKKANVKAKAEPKIIKDAGKEVKSTVPEIKIGKPIISGGRYVFATGRRKTSVANVRLFSGVGENIVNKISLTKYFQMPAHLAEVNQPFQYTGLEKDFYFIATISGGGIHSQSQALRHGIATALGSLGEEIRKILKKNGLLTRDDRKKERKKPGLKRARRSPQWAKR